MSLKNDAFGSHAAAMSRRSALASLGGGAVGLLWTAGCGAVSAQGPTFTPEQFGARGDGRSDDYEAMHRLAAAVNAAGGGTIRFASNRRYLIDRYITGSGATRNDVRHITFTNCRGLHIDLNGSAIDVKGDFHRAADGQSGGGRYVTATNRALNPLQFVLCHDLSVRNGELNGNVDRMTRDRNVIEGPGHGIELLGCERVLLEDLHIHHFPTDGIRMGIHALGNDELCRDVRMNRLRIMNNGRQGMTNAGGSGVVAVDCHFSETGVTGGEYRNHGPSAGVDVEPFRDLPVKSDFRGLRCRFDGNLGAPVVAGNPHRTGLVELIDCGGRVPEMKRMILSPEQATIRGGEWHNVQIACAYAARRRFTQQINIDVSGATWSGDDPGWQPVYDLNHRRPNVRIHDNRFRLLSPRPFTARALFQCGNPNHRFENNEVFVARTGHSGNGDDLVARFGARLVRGNRWSTDLRGPGRFVNDYSEARQVESESFVGAFAAVGRSV